MRELDCLFDPLAAADSGQAVHRLHAVTPDGLSACLAELAPTQRDYALFTNFVAKRGSVLILPAGEDGRMDAILGLGQDSSHAPFGALPYGLPAETLWQVVSPGVDPAQAVLGFCLGAYRFNELKQTGPKPARLARMKGTDEAQHQAWAIWMGRDLINRPANLLGPAELAQAMVSLADRFGAPCDVILGEQLRENYPTIAAVGRGSVRAPHVAILRWHGSKADDTSPLVSLCGKGVCFDSGGYDLKPSAGMLRMKKDMGGAAAMMALAAQIMAADLPLRLVLRVGCVENSVSGDAMRPLDVIRTRSGKTVEIGNTDAEGRLVLCDLLDEAGSESPDILIDAATLTGAARTALGPDLPALFANDAEWSNIVVESGKAVHDPVWPLPLWPGYDAWLDSSIANLNNVSSNGFAGAITAALFLQRFVTPPQNWIHLDLYAWNDRGNLVFPEGGEVQTSRCLFRALLNRYKCSLQ